jgi:hypothetical protein
VENVADRGHAPARYRHITDLEPAGVHLEDRASAEDHARRLLAGRDGGCLSTLVCFAHH